MQTDYREYKIICSCGHAGKIIYVENETPFSSLREYYKGEGIIADPYVTSAATWVDVFENMRPVCPECGQILSMRHLVDM